MEQGLTGKQEEQEHGGNKGEQGNRKTANRGTREQGNRGTKEQGNKGTISYNFAFDHDATKIPQNRRS